MHYNKEKFGNKSVQIMLNEIILERKKIGKKQ